MNEFTGHDEDHASADQDGVRDYWFGELCWRCSQCGRTWGPDVKRCGACKKERAEEKEKVK